MALSRGQGLFLAAVGCFPRHHLPRGTAALSGLWCTECAALHEPASTGILPDSGCGWEAPRDESRAPGENQSHFTTNGGALTFTRPQEAIQSNEKLQRAFGCGMLRRMLVASAAVDGTRS